MVKSFPLMVKSFPSMVKSFPSVVKSFPLMVKRFPLQVMSLFSTVKVFPEWNHFSEPWNVFYSCKWITNKKHFRQGKMISWANFLQVENGTLFNDNWNCVFSVKKTVKKTITSSFSSLVEKTVMKNAKGVKSFFQPMKKKTGKTWSNSGQNWTK